VRAESLKRLRQNEPTEPQQAISYSLAALARLTEEHDRAWNAYRGGGDHKRRIPALETATEARRQRA
jgi:hypothetical protein